MVKALFVCMGNICRSPTAEAVFRDHVEHAGLSERFLIDSAGTHGYYVGEPPDRRAQQAARLCGYEMANLRGRQVGRGDFHEFDYVLAMDRDNLAILRRLAPPDAKAQVRLSDIRRASGCCRIRAL